MIGRALHAVDELLAQVSIRLLGEDSVLLTFLFHAILLDEDVGPTLGMEGSLVVTASGFGRFIDYFRSAGYSFVSPDEIAAGLPPGGRYVLSTFDDGYYNNFLALPALEEHRVPAAFYISTGHIRSGDAYWWDVVYRKRTSEGASRGAVSAEMTEFKSLTHDAIRDRVLERFGPEALKPAGDHDRPMTEAELREFSRNPWVHLGNHTVHHAILTNYDHRGLLEEIRGAQVYLEGVTGRAPISVSYPNGNHSEDVVGAAAACGLKVGITTVEEPNRLPLDGSSSLRLGRFRFDHLTDQPRRLAVYRSGGSVVRWARRLRYGKGAS